MIKQKTKLANKIISKTIKSQAHEYTINKCLSPQITKISRALTKAMVAL